MHNHLPALLLMLLISGSVFAAKETLPYKTDVVIDGLNKEWTSPLPKYHKATGINYSIANDRRNIYLIIRIADEVAQKQIMQNGLEVWVNKQGQKKKVTGVTLPFAMAKDFKAGKMGQSGPEMQDRQKVQENETAENQSSENGQKARTDFQENPKNGSQPMMGQDIPLPANELTLTGFLIDNGKQPTKGCPVRVSLSRDRSNCLIYELAIPFNTFYKEILDESDANIPFCFGFVVKGPEKSISENEMNIRRPGGMEGMGGPGSMGGPGGMGGMGGGGMGAPFIANTDKVFWLKAGLAVQ